VRGEAFVVRVDQKSQSAWSAVGDYMGESIKVEDGSEGGAVERWREAATAKGNL
jgi:hypothetical protein